MGNRDLELDAKGELGSKVNVRETRQTFLHVEIVLPVELPMNCESVERGRNAPFVWQVSDVISSGARAVDVDIDSSFGSDVPEDCFAHWRATYVAQTDDKDPKRRFLRLRHFWFKFPLRAKWLS
jgi:hypothetical protein